MRDCENVDLREVLPDFAADRLTGAARAWVVAHIADCADCAAEVELLRVARLAMTRDTPAVDVARIVAALPAPPQAAVARPVLVRVDGAPGRAGQAVRPVASRSDQVVRHRPMWTGWRVAAAVSTIAVGGLSVAVLRDLSSRGGSVATVHAEVRAVQESPEGGASAQRGRSPVVNPRAPASVSPATIAATPAGARPAGAQPASVAAAEGTPSGADGNTETLASAGPGMAVAGSISDLSDGEVEGLLHDLDGLEASPSDEPDAAAPGLHAAVTP